MSSGGVILEGVKALTFDTGGTILDWHTGFSKALANAGAKYGLEKDWGAIANELRRRSLGRMINLGENSPPEYNFDDSHRVVLYELIAENTGTIFIGGPPITSKHGRISRQFCLDFGKASSAPRSPFSALESSLTLPSGTTWPGTPFFHARPLESRRYCQRPI